MDVLKKYTIAHKGLSIGNHDFEFKVDDSFFNAVEGTDILGGEAEVKLRVQKQGNMLVMDFDITGSVRVECDRCLEEVELPVDVESTLQVRFSETENESDGDIMWLNPAETEISLAQYIYETIYLSLPCQRVHEDDENGNSGCDPEMLARFKVVDQDEFDRIAEAEATLEMPLDKLEELKKKLK